MKKLLSKFSLPQIRNFIITHKVWSAVIALVIVFVGYKVVSAVMSTAGEPRYVLGIVERGSLISTVSSTGTVSSSDQIDLKSKVSGDITTVLVKSGQEVTKGTVLVKIDSRDAYNTLRTAQIALQKLTNPADDVDRTQAENAYNDALNAQSQAYDSGINDVASAFVEVPEVMAGLDSMLGGLSGYLSSTNVLYYGDTARQYRDQAGTAYNIAKDKYSILLLQYKAVSRSSASSSIALLVSDTYTMVKLVSEALKNAKGAVDYIVSQNQGLTASQISAGTSAGASLNTWTDRINPRVAALLSDKNSIEQSAGNIANKKASLDKLIRGADPLDIESAELNVSEKLKTYADYTIVAPFDGVVGRLPVKVGDTATNGTVMATIITKEQMADISLNEVDAAKVKVGDKATMTFDAVEGLSLTGVISDLDLVGTANQGVVNYGAKIIFDSNDARVRSGMSVSAEITTNILEDVLSVPTSAVKIDPRGSYVLAFDPPIIETKGQAFVTTKIAPKMIRVEVGASNDTLTEIVSGLEEEQQIVFRTVSSSAVVTSSAPTLFGGGGSTVRAGGTGNVRVVAPGR